MDIDSHNKSIDQVHPNIINLQMSQFNEKNNCSKDKKLVTKVLEDVLTLGAEGSRAFPSLNSLTLC